MIDHSHSGNKQLVLADWSAGGHNSLYLNLIVESASSDFDQIEVRSPYRECFSGLNKGPDYGVLWREFRKRRSTRFPLPRSIQGQAGAFFAGRALRKSVFGGSFSGDTTVFFPCLFDWESFYIRWFFRGFRRSAIGLLVAADFLRNESVEGEKLSSVLRRSPLRRLATLDEYRVEELQKRIGPQKTASWLPDVTFSSCVDSGKVHNRAMEAATGRPIVLLIGRLAAKKGIVRFIDLANADAEESCLFVMAGEWLPETLRGSERGYVETALEERSNLLLLEGKIPLEEEYNAIIRDAAWVFLGYEDFSGSSNNLTKAGLLGTPVVAEEGYLLGDRVKRYELGILMEKNEPAEVTWSKMCRFKESHDWRQKDLCSQFRDSFSGERFGGELRKLLFSDS
ncbi:MAG: hypothetical protein AAGJ81_11675 [Verrucomicrobiota bacterium]